MDRPLGLKWLPRNEYDSIPLAAVPRRGTLPPSVDLSPNMPPPGDQGNQGSCVGWAIGYGLKGYQERIERNWDSNVAAHQFSPAFVYNQIHLTPDPECDNGSYMTDALNLLSNVGIPPLSVMPYTESDCTLQPTADQYSAAEPFRIAYWRKVNQMDLNEVKSHLAAGRPLPIGIDIYESFAPLGTAGSNAVYDRIEGAYLGGHAVLACGYDNSTGWVKVLNSWGASWGDGGYFYITYDLWPQVVGEAYFAQDIVDNSPLDISASATPPTINAGQSSILSVGVTGGQPPYTYEWTPSASLSDSTSPSPTATPSVTTAYMVVVRDSAGGEANAVVTVTVGSSTTRFGLTVDKIGVGSVFPEQGEYEFSSTVQVLATPDAGWQFERWEGDVGGTMNPISLVMDGNKSIRAVFVEAKYQLAVQTVGQGQVDVHGGTFEHGSVVTVTATPNFAWKFAYWEGDYSGTANPATITMDRNKTVRAVFTEYLRWSKMSTPRSDTLWDVWGSAPNHVIAVGSNGTILRFNGVVWTTQSASIPSFNKFVLQSVWGSGPSDVYVAGYQPKSDTTTIYGPAKMLHYDGTGWSDMGISWGAVSKMDVWGFGSYSVLYTMLNANLPPYISHLTEYYNGYSWTTIRDSLTPFAAIWGTSYNDVYGAGGSNSIEHFDGDSWTRVYNPGMQCRAIGGSGPTDVYVVGDGIVHYNGTRWTKMDGPSGLNAVWSSGPNSAFAVGTNKIVHFDGSTWQPMNLPISVKFYGVWGTSDQNVFAVGEGGTILRFGP